VGSDDLYFLHRSAIEQTIRAVCRRQRLLPQDAEDFASTVRVHLIDNDYAVLRRFEGRSSIATYLVTVVTHLALDWRNARWGKWRPSAEARRQGPVATQLERLTRRDDLTFEEACETLRTNFHVTESREDLEAMAARLPLRSGRRFVPDDQLEGVADADPTPDALLERQHAAEKARVAIGLLAAAIASLPPQDALIVKLKFQDGMRIADIARTLNLDDKPLYRRIARLLPQLREALEKNGLNADAARDLLARQGFDDARDPGAEIAGRVRLIIRERSNVSGGPR
jgi:RNA polymerase sigma factor (sigma-70 family)